MRNAFQTLPLRAGGAIGELRWSVNGRTIARARAEEPVDWPLAAGTHEIEVRDTRGRQARTTVTVK